MSNKSKSTRGGQACAIDTVPGSNSVKALVQCVLKSEPTDMDQLVIFSILFEYLISQGVFRQRKAHPGFKRMSTSGSRFCANIEPPQQDIVEEYTRYSAAVCPDDDVQSQQAILELLTRHNIWTNKGNKGGYSPNIAVIKPVLSRLVQNPSSISPNPQIRAMIQNYFYQLADTTTTDECLLESAERINIAKRANKQAIEDYIKQECEQYKACLTRKNKNLTNCIDEQRDALIDKFFEHTFRSIHTNIMSLEHLNRNPTPNSKQSEDYVQNVRDILRRILTDVAKITDKWEIAGRCTNIDASDKASLEQFMMGMYSVCITDLHDKLKPIVEKPTYADIQGILRLINPKAAAQFNTDEIKGLFEKNDLTSLLAYGQSVCDSIKKLAALPNIQKGGFGGHTTAEHLTNVSTICSIVFAFFGVIAVGLKGVPLIIATYVTVGIVLFLILLYFLLMWRMYDYNTAEASAANVTNAVLDIAKVPTNTIAADIKTVASGENLENLAKLEWEKANLLGGRKPIPKKPIATEKRIVIDGRKRVVYVGPRKGEYIKRDGKFVRLASVSPI